jgi:hypothetical protein
MNPKPVCALFVCVCGSLLAGQPAFPRFKVAEIDAHIEKEGKLGIKLFARRRGVRVVGAHISG